MLFSTSRNTARLGNIRRVIPLSLPYSVSCNKPAMAFAIDKSIGDDIPSITRIYAHAVRTGTGTFETVAPSEADMASRRNAVLTAGWPYIVAVDNAPEERSVIGFACAATFRPREAYRFTIEDSVYVAPEWARRGVGRALLQELLKRCEQAGARSAIAVIGDSENHGSLALHKQCGFEHAGVMPNVGWKFGRWLDVVLMTRPIGDGSASAPTQDT